MNTKEELLEWWDGRGEVIEDPVEFVDDLSNFRDKVGRDLDVNFIIPDEGWVRAEIYKPRRWKCPVHILFHKREAVKIQF